MPGTLGPPVPGVIRSPHPGTFLPFFGCETGFHQHHNGRGCVDGELAGLFQEIATTTDSFFGIRCFIISEVFHVITIVICLFLLGKSQPGL